MMSLTFLTLLLSQALTDWEKMITNLTKLLILRCTALLSILMKNFPHTVGPLSPQPLKEKKGKESMVVPQALLFMELLSNSLGQKLKNQSYFKVFCANLLCFFSRELGYENKVFSNLYCSSGSSENEASGNESMKISAKKPRRKLQPVSSESESSEDDIRKKVQSVEKVSTQQEAGTAVAPLTHSEKPAEPATLKRTRPFGAQSSTEKETQATQRQQKTQSKGKISPGKRKKSRSEATASYPSESMHIWCLEGKRISDIMELDVVLSVFENTLLEYRQRIESRSCKEAINNFFFNVKGELIKMLKEVQMLKTLKQKNTKIISDMEKKRQRLIEVQDELLRLEPQLKQLQTKYEELEDRKSSLKNSVHFLSDLKQLYRDYSGVQEKEPNVKEIYDSTSLPALLFKARTILGAKNHLQNINHQLGKLLGQK